MRKALLEELRKFCCLQRALVSAWRALCGNSHDLELLLDFPKNIQFESNGVRWEAVKHGGGVMFCSDGLVVDVPHGVQRPDVFDSDRFFDYLKSKKLLALLEPEDGDGRERLAKLFLEWSKMDLLKVQCDERGCAVSSFVQHEGACLECATTNRLGATFGYGDTCISQCQRR